MDTEVVEIRLTDAGGSFFVGMPCMTQEMFIEVCGALVPLDASSVHILHFQRFDRFRQIIIDNPVLASCQEQLQEAGYSMDLGCVQPELGSAKLLVRPDQVWRVIHALQWRLIKKPMRLKASDVIVSSEFKEILVEEVHRQAPRANPVVHEECLPLGPRVQARHTFLDVTTSSTSGCPTVHSSTDAHLGLKQNPRKRKGY